MVASLIAKSVWLPSTLSLQSFHLSIALSTPLPVSTMSLMVPSSITLIAPIIVPHMDTVLKRLVPALCTRLRMSRMSIALIMGSRIGAFVVYITVAVGFFPMFGLLAMISLVCA